MIVKRHAFGSFIPLHGFFISHTDLTELTDIIFDATSSVRSVVSVCPYSGPASPPPKQVFCPLVIPFGHVQEKRGIEGVRRIEGVHSVLCPLCALAIRFRP